MFYVNVVASEGLMRTILVLKRSVGECGIFWQSELLIKLVAKRSCCETAAETLENNNTNHFQPEKCLHSMEFGRLLRRVSSNRNGFYPVNG